MSENFYQHNNARHAQSQIPTKERARQSSLGGEARCSVSGEAFQTRASARMTLHSTPTRTRSHVNPLYCVAYCYVNVI